MDFVQVTLDALRASNLYAGAKKFHSHLIISVLNDPGFQSGVVHTATRISESGKRVNIEYSPKWLKSYCQKVLDLIENDKIRTKKNENRN